MNVYVMPMFYQLKTKDIEQSSKWFAEILGFQSLYQFRNQENQVTMDHLRLADYQDLMLIAADSFTVGDGAILNVAMIDLRNIAQKIPEKWIVEPFHGFSIKGSRKVDRGTFDGKAVECP